LYLIIAAVAAIAFTAFCCSVDGAGGGSNKFSWVIFRLYGRHIKLAMKLAVGVLVAFVGMMAVLQMNSEIREPIGAGNGGSYQTEKLAGFINRATLPVQWVVDGIINLLGFITLAVLLGLEQVASYYHQHSLPLHVALVILYLVWLGFNIYDLVSDELLSDDKGKRISWSFVTFGTWVFFVLLVSYISITRWSLLIN
jgi:hypothetical protein